MKSIELGLDLDGSSEESERLLEDAKRVGELMALSFYATCEGEGITKPSKELDEYICEGRR